MTTACIELKDFQLQTQIGTYGSKDTMPRQHFLDLILWIDSQLVLIAKDAMESVFDYDPLVLEIEKLTNDGHYETQERLMTRIVDACAKYSEIQSIEISLRKLPIRNESSSLGVRLIVDQATLSDIRTSISIA